MALSIARSSKGCVDVYLYFVKWLIANESLHPSQCVQVSQLFQASTDQVGLLNLVHKTSTAIRISDLAQLPRYSSFK
jgi:hypothetical protein